MQLELYFGLEFIPVAVTLELCHKIEPMIWSVSSALLPVRQYQNHSKYIKMSLNHRIQLQKLITPTDHPDRLG